MKKKSPVRGWSYFGVRNPEHVARDLDRMVADGANTVLFTTSEADLVFYAETMVELTGLAREREMTVYMNPWGFGRVFGGEAFSGLLQHHPDTAQMTNTGRFVPAVCPNHPEFTALLKRWIDLAAEAKADVAMWDEPHFFLGSLDRKQQLSEDEWVCRCPTCQAKYEKLTGEPMPMKMNFDVRAFREASLVGFLKKLTNYAHEKGLLNSICVLPPTWGMDDGFSDLELVYKLPHADIVATDPYWQWHHPEHDEAWVRRNYEENTDILLNLSRQYNRETEMWVKNYQTRAGEEFFVDVANEVLMEKGVRRVLAWSYLGSSYMSSLKSANPLLLHEKQSAWFKKMAAKK